MKRHDVMGDQMYHLPAVKPSCRSIFPNSFLIFKKDLVMPILRCFSRIK